MEVIVKANNLTKIYSKKKVLNGINLEVKKGKILGFLGPNGAGKTTFLKLASGLLRPTSGELLIDDHVPGLYTKSIVSYLPDVNFLFKWMKIKDAVRFFKDFFQDFDTEKAEKMLEFMKLNENDKVTTLSKGAVEKLNLSLVLSRKAKLYILDEPLSGVDPVAREKIIDAIIENFNEESAMIISTHLVNDVERLFDEAAFINNGQIVLQGNTDDLRIQKGKSIDAIFREVFAEC
ncbi:MAG: ABC transporter ATP-binding protein [Bacillota bacterium]|nr:ABC transporter ATP-binding protein [Bacillota bacterium]